MKHIPSIHPIFMNSKKHIIGILNSVVNMLFLSMSEVQESLDFLFLLASKVEKLSQRAAW